MADETIKLDCDREHRDWTVQMRGLTIALGIKALRRARRPKACWDDMLVDMQITSWKSYRSLRLRGFDVRAVGTWAVCNQAVQAVMAGRAFRPLSSRGDRSYADSIYRKANGVRVRSNREDFELEGATGDGYEDSDVDVMADWESFRETLQDDERELIETLECGDVERLGTVRGLKVKKRKLTDQFKEFRNR